MGFLKSGKHVPSLTETFNPPARDSLSGFFRLALAFLILAAFFLFLDFDETTKRLLEVFRLRGGLIPLGFYSFTWCGLVFSLLILFTNKSRLARYSSYFLSFISLAIFFGFKFLNGSGYGYNDAILTVNELVFAPEALKEYSGSAFFAVLLSLLAVFSIGYLCRKKLPATGKRYLVVVLFFIGCMFYIINRHTDLVIEDFPVVFNVPAVTFHAAANKLYAGPRSEPCLLTEDQGAARHIILVMDESIRGDHLSINGSGRDVTPFLRDTGLRLVNLGIASSAGNQSSTSNIIVQSGLSLDQVPDREHSALKNPSIFQYAKKRGRKTYFINAQESKLSNYMTRWDLLDIDNYIFIETEYPGSPKWEYDLLAADLIRSILETEQDTFIYVLKNGAHFPYQLMYPNSERVFRPVKDYLQEQLFFSKDDSGRMNSYDNAVRWSVNGFFRRLLHRQEKSDCLITYISDHGQSLDNKDGGPILTHNTVEDPPQDQANTPIFVVLSDSASERLGDERIGAMLKNKNKLSHFQVFPTMLCFMGYSKEEINLAYGPTIFDQVPDRRYFVSGDLFARSTFQINLFEGHGDAGIGARESRNAENP